MRSAQVFDKDIIASWKENVDRSTPVPVYYQLKLLIKGAIDSGILRNGEPIPTEAELSAELGVSRPTIRQCMAELVNEGYLSRMKGKGSFVSRPKIEVNYIAKHESFHTIIKNCGYTPSTRVLAFERIDGIPSINDKLQIPESEQLFHLSRLCMADGEPMLFSESYTQASRFDGLLAYNFAEQSLYTTLRDVYHTPIVVVKREISAANATQRDAGMLDIPKNKAICLVYNLAYDDADRPVEYSASRYRGDKIKFTNFMKC